MTVFEIFISGGSVVAATAAIAWMWHIDRTVCRERPRDPERLKRFIDRGLALKAEQEREAEQEFAAAFKSSRGTVPSDIELGIDDDRDVTPKPA